MQKSISDSHAKNLLMQNQGSTFKVFGNEVLGVI